MSEQTGTRTGSWWRSLGALPVAIAVLVAINAVTMLLVAVGNITDYGTNFAFVQHVLSMDTTNFGGEPGEGLDPDVMWRAITAPPLQHLAYITIIVWECATGLVLAWAVGCWLRGRRDGFAAARTASSVGLLMVVVLFGGGFIAIGGEWFQMWRSTSWNGLDSALRYLILAAFPLVLVHLPVVRRGSDAGAVS